MAKKILLRDIDSSELLPITRGELVLDSSGNQAFHSDEFLATDSQPGLLSPVEKQIIETFAGNVIDIELSSTSTNPVQNRAITQVINSIREKYLKSVSVNENVLTILDQSDNITEFVNSTYEVVSTTSDGLTPKIENLSDVTISNQTTAWVLTSTTGGKPSWRKLPTNAFNNTTYTLSGGFKEGIFTITLKSSGGSTSTATVPVMVGASTSSNGKAGLVPAPKTDNINQFLRSDGTWAESFNYYPTQFTWTSGTAEGPTGSLVGSGMSNVRFDAIPSASKTESGIVTTNTQSFSGQKTFVDGIKIGTSSTDQSTNKTKIYFGDGEFVWIGEASEDDSMTLHCGTSKKINFKIGDDVEAYVSNKGVCSVNGFFETSDEKAKNILNPIKINLDDLAKLRKIYYTWKEDKSENKLQLGMIAQEVQKIYPELVMFDPASGFLNLAYDKLSVIALAAIDNLYELFKEVLNNNNKLQKQLERLEKLI